MWIIYTFFIQIPRLEETKLPPNTLYQEPKEKKLLEEKRIINRREAENRLLQSSKLKPSCANVGTPVKPLAVQQKVSSRFIITVNKCN